MSNLTEQDYEGFHAVLRELEETFEFRKTYHAEQDWLAPEPLSEISDLRDDVEVYRDEISPFLTEKVERERRASDLAIGEAAWRGYYNVLMGGSDGEFSAFATKVQDAWIAAGKASATEALNG